MASCAIDCGEAIPTSISSAPWRAYFSRRDGNEMVVDDDVRGAEMVEAMDGDEARIAGPGANQIDGRMPHGWMPSTAACACCTSARISLGALRQQLVGRRQSHYA